MSEEGVCGGTPMTSALPIPSTSSAGSARSVRLIAEQWPIYAEAVLAKLDKGAADYGDASLDADSGKLLDEIEAELLDVNGWSFLLWSRIQSLRVKLKAIEERVDATISTRTR